MTIGLSILVFISACLCIWGKYNVHKNKFILYVFKPLTTILILIIAVISSYDLQNNYKFLIYGALLFSLLGDVMLMLPNKFLYGLVSFLMAHIIFTYGFYYLGQSFHLWLMILFIVCALSIYAYLFPTLGKYKYPVLIYVLTIFTMAWRAWEYFMQANDNGSLIIAIATLIFIVSDTNIALNKFKKPFKAAELIILSTYFISIWLISIAFTYMK